MIYELRVVTRRACGECHGRADMSYRSLDTGVRVYASQDASSRRPSGEHMSTFEQAIDLSLIHI